MKRLQKYGPLIFFILLTISFALIFTFTFFLTNWLFGLLNLTVPAIWKQLIDSMGGLFIFGLIVFILTLVFRSRRLEGERSMYGPIIEALEKIAKGDFNIMLENKTEWSEQRMLTQLIDSVNKMASELNQLEMMRQEFVSNVSHEIQTPLTSIRGFAQALQNETLAPEERQHYLSVIETESVRLSKLSDNLLKLASLEAEQIRFEPKPYRLDKQIRNLILAYEPQWADKQLDMDISLGEVTVTADKNMLNQVWLNLIYNSIKFTPQGGRIGIELNQYGDRVECRIADTGIGISEDDQTHIFERFYKADKSRTGLNEGSGLGLSIVKKIVELHKGSISLESQLGKGTTFIVCLPT